MELPVSGQVQREGSLKRSRTLRLAVVLWGGYVGGAETLSVALAEHMRRLGADVTIVFIEQPWSLAPRLALADVPYRALGFGRGRDVLRRPRRYAAGVADVGGNGALLVECGFMGAALRAGGYRGRIVAVEHGSLLGRRHLSKAREFLWRVDRLSGAWADDAEVAVSDGVLGRMRHHSHAREVRRIYNGIDPDRYRPLDEAPGGHASSFVVGFAGRLILGKGADHLIRAVAKMSEQIRIRLLIAGDGPERSHLEALAQAQGAGSKVRFLGTVNYLPGFWSSCDVAAVPPDVISESFSMTTLEAMACGKAIVASRNGAIPELMIDGVTGTLVEPGDADELARAVVAYAERPELRRAHGAAARARAIERFHIADCAQAYLDLFSDLAADRSARA
jgi:glycosyltransferase involved in cell wall biosynthesis